MSNVVAVLFAMVRNCVASGDVDTERIEAATPERLRQQVATWRHAIDVGDLPTVPSPHA
jgi:hypothetical protein